MSLVTQFGLSTAGIQVEVRVSSFLLEPGARVDCVVKRQRHCLAVAWVNPVEVGSKLRPVLAQFHDGDD
jgi:hypothetical protein